MVSACTVDVAQSAGCGSHGGAEPSGLNPYGDSLPDHGIGTRQPSRPWPMPVWNARGSWRTSGGRFSTSGSPSSSP